jgi:Lauroyl/myristoyl acyltransferase
MNYPDYLADRNKVFEYFSHENFVIWNDEFTMGKFNLVSASLQNYLPGISFAEHEKIFRGILMHQHVSILEQDIPDILQHVTFDGLRGDYVNMLKTHPVIICTFHTGSYRAINHFLFKNGINFSIVVAKSVFNTQAKDFENIHQNFYLQDTAVFNVIDAENPRSLFQMIREIKEGRVLVFYIDGNTGTEIKNEEKNNLCDIRFLHQRMYARKGIAYLSYITDTPVLTVGCYRKTFDDIHMIFHDLIFPDKEMDRESFSLQATQQMFDYIMPVIEKYPEQWEGWLYLYKSINLVNKVTTDVKYKPLPESELAEFKFNIAEFGICKIDELPYLFKKSTFSFYPITEDLYNTLHKGITKTIFKKELDNDIFFQLFENKTLICI